MLDLVLCNNCCSVMCDKFPLVQIDTYHPALQIEMSICDSISRFGSGELMCYNFRKANLNALYESLLITDWSIIEKVKCCCFTIFIL